METGGYYNLMKKTYSFKKQLEIGNKGEELFIKYYKDMDAKKSSDREIDIIIKNNKKVELKTDLWKMSDTKNFFIEKVSSNINKKKGGPFIAAQNKIDYFVYFFVKDKVFFWFSVKKLCNFLKDRIEDYRECRIYNKGYYSTGYLVPRADLEKLILRKDRF